MSLGEECPCTVFYSIRWELIEDKLSCHLFFNTRLFISQAVHPDWTIGGEVMLVRKPRKEKDFELKGRSLIERFPLHTTLAVRHEKPSHVAILSFSRSFGHLTSDPLVFAHYLQKVNKNVSLATELGVHAIR